MTAADVAYAVTSIIESPKAVNAKDSYSTIGMDAANKSNPSN
jgi:hypothetical protein